MPDYADAFAEFIKGPDNCSHAGSAYMAHEEIVAIRAMLAERSRPVCWAERRARLDEVGSVWPVADDIRCKSVDCGGVVGRARRRPLARADVLLWRRFDLSRPMVAEAGRPARMRTLAVGYRLAQASLPGRA
jgi:hypothetical protein